MTLGHMETAWICRSLGMLLHGGVGLGDGIFLLAQEASGSLKETLQTIGTHMDEGSSLADAMKGSGVFHDYVSGLIRVGEETGCTEEALLALAEYCETRSRTGRQIKNALAYPVMVMILMLVVVGVLLIMVLPVFDRVYGAMGSRLTGTAAGMLYLGQCLEQALPVLFFMLLLTVGAILVFCMVPPLKEKLRIFWKHRFGDRGIARKFNNAQFAQALAMGIRSGLSMEAAVVLAGELLREIPPASQRCEECAEALSSGVSLSDAMEQTGLLPVSECRMLSISQRSGNADQVTADIARRLMDQAHESLETTVGRIEPMLVLVSSLLVGIILLSVMLPLMDIMSALG